MSILKRGPGRPPKVSPEATEAAVEPLPNQERLIEVEIMRKYAPEGQPQEIKDVVYAGTVMSLPVQEAQRTLQLGIARATDNTFRG